MNPHRSDRSGYNFEVAANELTVAASPPIEMSTGSWVGLRVDPTSRHTQTTRLQPLPICRSARTKAIIVGDHVGVIHIRAVSPPDITAGLVASR